jgi:hypothetical protein
VVKKLLSVLVVRLNNQPDLLVSSQTRISELSRSKSSDWLYLASLFNLRILLVLTCVLLFPEICSWYLVRSPPVSQSTAASTALTSPRHYTELGVGGTRRFTVACATPPASQAELDWEAAPIALLREPERKGREGTRRGIAPGGS